MYFFHLSTEKPLKYVSNDTPDAVFGIASVNTTIAFLVFLSVDVSNNLSAFCKPS